MTRLTRENAPATLIDIRAPRVLPFTSSSSPTVDIEKYGAVTITNQSTAMTAMNTVGSARDFQPLKVRIHDDGTARALAWGPDFIDGGETLPATTIVGKTLLVGFLFNSVDQAFSCEAVSSRTVSTPIPPPSGSPIFVGDYSTGNFNQWTSIHTKYGSFTPPSGYPGGNNPYPLSLVTDPVKGANTARVEVRTGDLFAGGERCEVRGGFNAGGLEGDIRWFKFSTKFDSTYPTTWGPSDWIVTNQWHTEDTVAGSPMMSFGYVGWSGFIGSFELDSKAAVNVSTHVCLWHTPIAVGTWHDIVMEVKWSETAGYINLWRNGVQQTFDNGQTTWTGKTMVPGSSVTGGSYYKEGLYRRDPTTPTGILYHKNFACATTQANLP